MIINGSRMPWLLFLPFLVFFASCDCTMSDQEKWNIANGYLNNYKSNIIGSRYGGGENIYHEIIAVDYNCNGSSMKVGAIIRFTGQYSGAHYWVKGIVDVNRSSGNYTFSELDKDKDLALALKLQGIFEDKAKETINELIENKNGSAEEKVPEEVIASPEIQNAIDTPTKDE